MKSILFVLLMRINGDTSAVAVYESIEQCRDAQHAGVNLAAAYSCQPVDVRGTLSTTGRKR